MPNNFLEKINPFKKKETEAETKEKLVAQLNEAFKNGHSIVEASNLLQKIERPILVDFNNVLFNNSDPLTANPDALEPFRELEKIGTVVIVTNAFNWKSIQEFLIKAGFWSKETVLIADNNFSNLMAFQHSSPDADKLRRAYEKLAQENHLFEHPQMAGAELEPQFLWTGAPGQKRVAFAFMKPHLIPMIDDSKMSTNQNPGIYGIKLTPWKTPNEEISWRTKSEDTPKWLADAVPEVKELYEKVSLTGKKLDT